MCACKKRVIVEDGVCKKCHPDYIETLAGTSKVACAFFDNYAKELGVEIQHLHYDTHLKTVTGSEFAAPEWPTKKVDGYYVKADGTKVVIEFEGDYYHGHPRLWSQNEDAASYFDVPFKDMFEKTKSRLEKLFSFGYEVVYVWEYDYLRRGIFQSVQSVCFVFDGELRYNM